MHDGNDTNIRVNSTDFGILKFEKPEGSNLTCLLYGMFFLLVIVGIGSLIIGLINGSAQLLWFGVITFIAAASLYFLSTKIQNKQLERHQDKHVELAIGAIIKKGGDSLKLSKWQVRMSTPSTEDDVGKVISIEELDDNTGCLSEVHKLAELKLIVNVSVSSDKRGGGLDVTSITLLRDNIRQFEILSYKDFQVVLCTNEKTYPLKLLNIETESNLLHVLGLIGEGLLRNNTSIDTKIVFHVDKRNMLAAGVMYGFVGTAIASHKDSRVKERLAQVESDSMRDANTGFTFSEMTNRYKWSVEMKEEMVY